MHPASDPVGSTVHCYHVLGRTPGTGPVIAVLTDGHTDLAVAATAAAWAAQTRTLLVAAVAVADTGFSINALLHHVRDRRFDEESGAVVGRVTPTLTDLGVAWTRAIIPVPAASDSARSLPLHAVGRLIDGFGAVAVVAAAALHDPTGRLQPINDEPVPADPFLPSQLLEPSGSARVVTSDPRNSRTRRSA